MDVYSDADWKGDKAARRSVSAGLIGGHSRSCRYPQPRVSCTQPSRQHQKVSGSRAWQRTWVTCGLNLHLDASATMCLVSCRGLGKAEHVDMQNLWIQESGRFVTKKVGTNVYPADLMTKPLARSKAEQHVSLMGYEFMRPDAVTRKESTRVSATV